MSTCLIRVLHVHYKFRPSVYVKNYIKKVKRLRVLNYDIIQPKFLHLKLL